jgi:hypothetical protein
VKRDEHNKTTVPNPRNKTTVPAKRKQGSPIPIIPSAPLVPKEMVLPREDWEQATVAYQEESGRYSYIGDSETELFKNLKPKK